MSIQQYGVTPLRTALRKDDNFLAVYEKLLCGNELSSGELRYLLRIAIALLSMANKDKDSAYFGYSMIVRYSNYTSNYEALYDVAMAHNYMPIVNVIDRIRGDIVESDDDNFHDLFVDSLKSTFLDERSDSYRSEGQLELVNFMAITENAAVVAPTSYGKSELIIEEVRSSISGQKNVCIVVPTKALVTQTKKRLYARSIRRVITHPDMYTSRLFGYTGFVAVLTQERLLSLFTRNKELRMDTLFIDEAHNMLDDDERSVLLSQVILIAKKRNTEVNVNYFTPFLADTENLTVLRGTEPNGFLTEERMKVERYFYRLRGNDSVLIYDQFLDTSFTYQHRSPSDAASFIIENGSDKNIVYLNMPREVSRFATDLASHLPDIEMTDHLKKAMEAIAGYTSPLYNIIACLKKGVLFHHGSMPDVVKMYVENLYSEGLIDIKYLVTTSTLLEGVNIPANRLFIVNSAIGRGALSDSQLKNLAGRVGRYSELFSKSATDISLLEPRIYLVNDGDYERNTIGNPENFYNSRVKLGKKIVDKVENPLLQKAHLVSAERLEKELTYLSNVEEGIQLTDLTIRTATTAIGKSLFEHSARDFDILLNEAILNENYESFFSRMSSKVEDTEQLFNAIEAIFINNVNILEYSSTYFIANYSGVKAHHQWYLEKNIEQPSLNFLISIILYSWRDVTTVVFVGGMGDVDKHGERNGFNTNYALVNRKNQSDRVSLAISKIKVDRDMLENCIMKYVEVMNDMGLLSEDYYNKVKYHTTDQFIILLLKQGASHELAMLLAEKYKDYVVADENEIIRIIGDKDTVLRLMDENDENEIIKFEFKNFI